MASLRLKQVCSHLLVTPSYRQLKTELKQQMDFNHSTQLKTYWHTLVYSLLSTIYYSAYSSVISKALTTLVINEEHLRPRLFLILHSRAINVHCLYQSGVHKLQYCLCTAITRERQRFSKMSQIAIYSRGDLVRAFCCGVEVNTVPGDRMNEKTSQNPRRVAHCRVSSLVMVCSQPVSY